MVFALAGDSTTTRLRANGDPLFIVGGRAERRSVAGRPSLLSRPDEHRVFPTTVHRAVHNPPQVEERWVVGRGSDWSGTSGFSAAWVARVTPPRRAERHSAQASRAMATSPIRARSSLSSATATTVGAISTATRFITLISGLRAGPGVVLERVADGVADHGRLVGLGVLAAVVTVLHVLLGVVPGAARNRQHDRQELAGEDGPGQGGAERGRLEQEPGGDRGQHRQQPRGEQLAQRVAGADVDHGAVVGTLAVVHDPRGGAELLAAPNPPPAGGPAHGPDRLGRKHERHRAAD